MNEVPKRYYLESVRWKYHRAGKKQKGVLLTEVCERLGCHRKHAIRLMKPRKRGRKPAGKKRGRKSKYDDPEFLKALHLVRKLMEYRNADVICANMEEWLPHIERHHGEFPAEIRNKLLSISPSTVKRYVKLRREAGGRGLCTTRPGSLLRNEIPIQTYSEWDETMPGKMSTDTVAHCGNSTAGQYVISLDMVDPVTHWVELRAVWGKGHHGVLEQAKSIERALPFPLTGLHVDNGGEFINHAFIRHFTYGPKRHNFLFTRSRAYKKDDNCYVEQKNWSVVRRYFGYDRFGYGELVPLMNDLYENELSQYLNHFCRTFKVEEKIRVKSRYRRKYGAPETPYERVLASEYVTENRKENLRAIHAELDPVYLQRRVEQKLGKIFSTLKKLRKSRIPS